MMKTNVWGKAIYCLLLVGLLGLLLLNVWPPNEMSAAEVPKSKPVVFKTVLYFVGGEQNLDSLGFFMYKDKLSKASNGELTFNVIGGPEAIHGDAQTQALLTGVVDANLTTATRFGPLVPEGDATALSEITLTQEREVGFYDLLADLYKKVGAIYLGRTQANYGFYLWTRVKIEKLVDVKGLKFRATPYYEPLLKALGIVPVSMPMGDVYEAMDRGVVDGWVGPVGPAVTEHFYEVTKYIINPSNPFWRGQSTMLMLNLNTWNRLSKSQQDLMIRVMKEVEKEIVQVYGKKADELLKEVMSKGVKPIELSAADVERFRVAAIEPKWELLNKKSPELGPKIRAMLTKK